MNNQRLHLPAGSCARDGCVTHLDPDSVSSEFCSLRVVDLDAGAAHEFHTGDSEWIVLPLARSYTVSDPDHAWVRDTWTGVPVDPRLPLYTAPTAEENAR